MYLFLLPLTGLPPFYSLSLYLSLPLSLTHALAHTQGSALWCFVLPTQGQWEDCFQPPCVLPFPRRALLYVALSTPVRFCHNASRFCGSVHFFLINFFFSNRGEEGSRFFFSFFFYPCALQASRASNCTPSSSAPTKSVAWLAETA